MGAVVEDCTDDACVERIRLGDAETGLLMLQERYGARLLHFVQGIVRDAHLAQDVLQEVWQRVYTKHHLYRQGTNFRAWIFEVARNQARSALRSGRHVPRPVSSLASGKEEETNQILNSIETHDDRSIEEREFMAEFEKAVASLSDDYRRVFTLCVRQGTAYAEAGRRLSLPTGTVAIRIMRARKQLYRMLERHLDRLRRPPACFQ